MTDIFKSKAIDINDYNEKSKDKRKQFNILQKKPTNDHSVYLNKLEQTPDRENLKLSISHQGSTHSNEQIRNLNLSQINQINISKK